MAFSLSIVGALLLVGIGFSRVNARRDKKPSVQKLFGAK